MSGKTIYAAGGIVVRSGARPLIAVVQRSKDDRWVLPRGKLKRNERAVRRRAPRSGGGDRPSRARARISRRHHLPGARPAEGGAVLAHAGGGESEPRPDEGHRRGRVAAAGGCGAAIELSAGASCFCAASAATLAAPQAAPRAAQETRRTAAKPRRRRAQEHARGKRRTVLQRACSSRARRRITSSAAAIAPQVLPKFNPPTGPKANSKRPIHRAFTRKIGTSRTKTNVNDCGTR